MYKGLHISLIFRSLGVSELSVYNHPMYNLYAIFAKFLNTCR